MKAVVLSYNKFSNGARVVAKGLGLGKPQTNQQIGAYVAAYHTNTKAGIINWGSGSCKPAVREQAPVFLNSTAAVNLCRDKLKFFKAMDGEVRIPDFTADLDTALEWGRAGQEVLGRDPQGSAGTDIVFFSEDPIAFATKKLFVKYKKKKAEFRLHIMDGKLLFAQKKVLRTSDISGQPINPADVDFRVRNHRNGFIFQRNDVHVPEDVKVQSFKAIARTGLDFGAVDVIYNEYEDKAYVLEVNTAPGLEGSSIDEYVSGLRGLYNKRMAAVASV